MFGEWWHSDLGLALTLMLQLMLIAVSVNLTIHILLNKSDPKASLMWIALVWFAPIFGAVFYLLFGINRITRRARRLSQIENSGSDSFIDHDDFDFADDPWIEFRRLANHITHSRRSRGNDIEIIEGIEPIHRAMVSAIQTAEKTIVLSTYIFRRDDLELRWPMHWSLQINAAWMSKYCWTVWVMDFSVQRLSGNSGQEVLM